MTDFEKALHNEMSAIADTQPCEPWLDKDMEAIALWARDFTLKEQAELVEALCCEANNVSGWLKRMSSLKWDDKEYAPNFKAAHERLESALSKLKAKGGV